MENKKNTLTKAVCSTAMLLSLAACSTTDATYQEAGIHDPFEKVNRATFAFNQGVDDVILEPAAKGYRAVTEHCQSGFTRRCGRRRV